MEYRPCYGRFPANTVLIIRAGTLMGLPMNAFPGDTELAACRAFCRKPLPTLNGELQPWRAPNAKTGESGSE